MALLPVGKLSYRKGSVHGSHAPLCPLLLYLLIHLIPEHHLHQPVNRKRLALRIASQKGVAPQVGKSGIQSYWIGSHRCEHGSQVGCPGSHDLFRDGIRVEEGTEPE